MPRWAYWCLLGATLVACDKLNTNREVEQYGTFGEVIYRESCQRVAYMGQLEQQAAGERTTVDVSGQYGRTVCVDGAAPPTDAPPKLSAIVQQKSALITLVATLFPKGSDLLNQLEPFLEQLLPLSDDGTMQRAIASLGDTLGTMEKDPDFSPALARLALRNGYRPTKTAAGLVHTILDYPGFDLGPLKDPSDPKTKQPSFMQSVLDLLAPGGTAETEWKQLLLAGSW